MCIRDRAFAVDVFAAENELVISDRELAKQISAAELRGEKIGFFSDYPVDGIVPAEITPGVWQKENIYVTLKPVSYTHLDVYKRQEEGRAIFCECYSIYFVPKIRSPASPRPGQM